MGRLLTITALILTAGAATGCYPCMQNSYYDPYCGVVYGPSIQTPTFMSGFKKHKHAEHTCPLCISQTEKDHHKSVKSHDVSPCSCGHDHGATFGSQHPIPANYGAAFQGNCPVNCDPCCVSQHQTTVSDCDDCSTFGDSYSGTAYDQTPMMLPSVTMAPGQTFGSGTFSAEGCQDCETIVSGPLFNGQPIPETETMKPSVRTPAPGVDTEMPPGAIGTPTPDLSRGTTMMIPAFPTSRPSSKTTRHVHWVPNELQ